MWEYLITRPLGFIINFIYGFVQNYGWSIILFTVIVKMILLPLNIRSQKAMKKQQKIQPYLAELQKKYANDKEKLQTEMMKLYRENNVSMTGGCLPLLIQFPILIGFYQVIRRPITYLAGVTNWKLPEVVDKVTTLKETVMAQFPNLVGNLGNYSVENFEKNGQIELASWASKVNGAEDAWAINFDFFGLDLADVPSKALNALNSLLNGQAVEWGVLLLLLIPVLAVFTSWLSMKITQMQQNKGQENADTQVNEMSKSMNLMMPLMTGFFTFTLPSGMGVYWIVSNIAQILQQIILNHIFDNKEDEIDVKLPEKNRKKRKK